VSTQQITEDSRPRAPLLWRTTYQNHASWRLADALRTL